MPIYSKRAGRKGKKPPGVGIHSCALQPNLPASKNRNAGLCSLAQRRTFCFGPHPPAKWKNLSQLGRCLQREKIEKLPKTIMHSLFDYLPKADRMGRKNRSRCRHKNGRREGKQGGSPTLRDCRSPKRPLRKTKGARAEEFSHRKSHRLGRWQCAFSFYFARYGVMGGWFVRCSPMIFSIQII